MKNILFLTTGTSNIEQREGDTINGTKAIDDSNCYASTIKTSEGENNTSQMSLSYWQH